MSIIYCLKTVNTWQTLQIFEFLIKSKAKILSNCFLNIYKRANHFFVIVDEQPLEREKQKFKVSKNGKF